MSSFQRKVDRFAEWLLPVVTLWALTVVFVFMLATIGFVGVCAYTFLTGGSFQ